MPRRLLKLVSNSLSRTSTPSPIYAFSAADVAWVMGSFCALNRKPFDAELLLKQFPPPYSADTLIHAARALGFRIKRRDGNSTELLKLSLPCLILLKEADSSEPASRPAILVQATQANVVLFEVGGNTPQTLTHAELAARYAGTAFQLTLETKGIKDPDGALTNKAGFGFAWFVPELLKHKRVWRDVLIASLIIQLLALGVPLFTQVIIDKVVVHRTQSTLIVIGIGLAVFMLFSALLSWVRQYLVLHTGNRVDAVLGASVFQHLLKLPTRYFEHRPTGVIAARLHGVETIREFIASAAVTLLLDLPFLLIFLAMMFYYSVTLTLIAVAIMGVIAIMSFIMAPLFRNRLNEQFLLGARNQAFTTEYVAGIETVKSLQMEPQLNVRYSDYLAEYLRSGFGVRQIGNTYNTASNALEQLMTLLILIIGAYTVMNSAAPGAGAGQVFTIGMLVAFQMYASRVSQPMLRLVGLWQQFQQANLSVQRLGDLMNAPAEPYSVSPTRLRAGKGLIEIEDLSFRYADNLPFLYQGFGLKVSPGKVVAIMGPSGSGKSTLTKLLQGFYQASGGTIKVDGTDIRYLSANELRHYFGVVPQETILFSGTLYDNLLMANPHATFEQVVQACRMAEIHSTIEALPQGYQTEIGERGVGLSGGQKQRLAIARALIKQPRILIFDEATSNLDAHTAEHFAATINQLKGQVTMLFITHALPKNLLVDEVVRIGRTLTAVGGAPEDNQTGS
ncbi:peptidase domain-containing ABC transporter [Hydrogenophaga sp.]|uniref:peptidase domain-containing ABC transporter n=1 Tax=Hydrogenophaga sp. TaxID=1904254 RepID=UPI0027209679|nr:peptidase domain-containing ABC transporter [Hydrogenophaga sp.]MDO9438529.1 peptidase domain-containing ABC transporter [Hydrogenophaga sp.]